MLTDMIEGEFDIKEEEPWYDHQDLEHDLQLAAELGKNLLERNRELEQGLQQMYATNQEQLQEIEYLSKQVDLLRSVNDQHAKVYEQLDVTARDLEQTNQRLVLENRAAQLKIEGLTETVEGLQTQVEELQRDVKEQKLVSAEQTRPSAHLEPPQPCYDQGFTCNKKQCQLHKYCSYKHSFYASRSSLKEEQEEEHLDLLSSISSLQAQLSTERTLREAAEQEADALAHELSELEPKLALLGDYQDRLVEMETEVEELRILLRSSTQTLLPDTVFLSSEEEVGVVKHRVCGLKRCCSERQLRSFVCDERGATDSVSENGRGCFQHIEEVKHHNISLLNEVDAQYTALQEKYNTLLRHCESGMLPQNHKAVQTPANSSVQTHTHSQSASTQDDAQLPEYKALFQEIFTFIQKSKKDLKENRMKPSQVE
ncbi:cerebellar degeneration-related protein 2-like isoform X1 [Myxocyprinus asiaticus]|uniref:cerebellar degeneration-related protein 2-like isoform X1 n=1 Tax=Myxocyprinus asiaticus TaxID=70543 RepID=UPI00222179EC|nr:cerebellar degeneration-related protein 2-like isoform X1 [Myxocyprinus asiaticus]